MQTPTKEDLKKIAEIEDADFEEIVTDLIEGNRVLTVKEVKEKGDYSIKGYMLPNNKELLEIVGNCPACGEMFMGKIEPDSKKLPCTNKKCEFDIFTKDRKIYCQKRNLIES